MPRSRDEILALVQRHEAEALTFLQDFTRIDTSNPPGDTRTGAGFIRDFLAARGAEVQMIAPQADMPNIVATTGFAAPGRHLVFNGHIDVFPIGPRADWTHDPLGGALIDGRIHGRGTVDMKCGTTAMIFAWLILREMADDLTGRATLTVVSDEETGGRWGAGYLIENHPDLVLGDCLLNSEPSGPGTVRFGEKSPTWFRFRIKTPGAHGAYPHLSPSATKIAARLMLDLEQLESIVPDAPGSVLRVLSEPATMAAIERALGKGANETLARVTVNFGMISGGIKLNIIPGEVVLEADIRMPVGTTAAQLRAAVQGIAASYPQVTVEDMQHFTFDPTCSDPDHEMMHRLMDAAASLQGSRPVPVVSLGGSDCRYWRMKGVPAYIYGCSPDGMGVANESVSVDEFRQVLRTHVLAAAGYLGAPGAG